MRFLICAFLLVSINVFASDKQQSIDNITGLDIDSKSSNKKQTYEYGFTQITFGSAIIKSNQKKIKGSQLSIGHLRFADAFCYGMSYNRIDSSNEISGDGFNASLGSMMQLQTKIKPFGLFEFGIANLNNKVSSTKSSGFYSGLNIGLQLSESLPFHFFTGIKYGKYLTDKETIYLESLYFSMGLEF